MTLDHRISFRVKLKEWEEFQSRCEQKGVVPSDVLRSAFRRLLKGGKVSYTIEDFALAYVDEWEDFEEALSLAVDRDEEAANELLASIHDEEV